MPHAAEGPTPAEPETTAGAWTTPAALIEPVLKSRPAPLEAMSYESRHSADQLISKTPDAKPLPPNQGPQFVAEASRNVTALAGRVASLTCRIKNLDNWTVRFDAHQLRSRCST